MQRHLHIGYFYHLPPTEDWFTLASALISLLTPLVFADPIKKKLTIPPRDIKIIPIATSREL